jgi:hypothetical protein
MQCKAHKSKSNVYSNILGGTMDTYYFQQNESHYPPPDFGDDFPGRTHLDCQRFRDERAPTLSGEQEYGLLYYSFGFVHQLVLGLVFSVEAVVLRGH